MDTVLLRTFLEVSKTRHFGRAAENLCLTHSAVSFRIRQLEELVGVKLFDRKRNNLGLTVAGERLIPYAEGILGSWQMALQDVGLSSDQMVQLTLGGTANIWDSCLQRLLPEIAVAFPQLAQRTEVNTQIRLASAVLEGQVDLALLFDPPKSPDLVIERVMALNLILVSQQPQVTLAQLPELGYVYVDWGTAFSIQHAKLLDRSVAPVLHTGQSQVALEYLLGRGGAAFMPEQLVSEQLQAQQLFRVADSPSISRDVYAVYHNANDKLEPVRALVDFIVAQGKALGG